MASTAPTRHRTRPSMPAVRSAYIVPRISTLAPAAKTGAVSKSSALLALSTLASEARDLVAPEPSADLVAASSHARSLLERGVAVLTELQELEPEGDVSDEDLDGMFDDAESAVAREAKVGDLCFAGLIELRTAIRGLVDAKRPADRIAAVEMSGRRLRGALRAVLSLATVGTDTPPELPSNEELESALASRRAYSKLRRSLRRAESHTVDAVLRAIQYGAGALAALASSPDYAKLVESDRATLRELRDRAFAWAKGSRDVADGLALIEDLHTSADILRKINERSELRAHDRAVFSAVEAAQSDDERRSLLVPVLGRDDELDALVARLDAGEATELVWALVILRFGALR